MTQIRVNSAYGLNGWGNYYQHQAQAPKQDSNRVSIWGETPSTEKFARNEIERYLNSLNLDPFTKSKIKELLEGEKANSKKGAQQPAPAPAPAAPNSAQQPQQPQLSPNYVPMDQLMTAPFGVPSMNTAAANPFTSANSASIFTNAPVRANSTNSNFLGLTANHAPSLRYSHTTINNGNNIFSNTRVNASNFDSLKLTNTRISSGFGSTVRGSSVNIANGSTRISDNSLNFGGNSINSTRVSGDIERFKQTNTHITSPNADLNRRVTEVEDKNNIYRITKTKGTMYV